MNPLSKIKHRFHQIVLGQHLNERWTAIFNLGLSLLILLNVLTMMLETMDGLYHEWRAFFISFELISVVIFLVEYLIRVWVSDLTPKYQKPISGRIRYMFSPMALIDLMAILPSLLFLGSADLRFLRTVRLFRVIRLLHIPHYNQAMHSIWQAAKSKKAEFMIVGVIMTLTTVGYGDVYPITTLGKITASFFAALGIGFFALPSAILASALIEQSRNKYKNKACPHCGGELHD